MGANREDQLAWICSCSLADAGLGRLRQPKSGPRAWEWGFGCDLMAMSKLHCPPRSSLPTGMPSPNPFCLLHTFSGHTWLVQDQPPLALQQHCRVDATSCVTTSTNGLYDKFATALRWHKCLELAEEGWVGLHCPNVSWQGTVSPACPLFKVLTFFTKCICQCP